MSNSSSPETRLHSRVPASRSRVAVPPATSQLLEHGDVFPHLAKSDNIEMLRSKPPLSLSGEQLQLSPISYSEGLSSNGLGDTSLALSGRGPSVRQPIYPALAVSPQIHRPPRRPSQDASMVVGPRPKAGIGYSNESHRSPNAPVNHSTRSNNDQTVKAKLPDHEIGHRDRQPFVRRPLHSGAADLPHESVTMNIIASSAPRQPMKHHTPSKSGRDSTNIEANVDHSGMTEASAYAKAITASLTKVKIPSGPSRQTTASAPPIVHQSRPLPRTPSTPQRTVSAFPASTTTMHIIASSDSSSFLIDSSKKSGLVESSLSTRKNNPIAQSRMGSGRDPTASTCMSELAPCLPAESIFRTVNQETGGAHSRLQKAGSSESLSFTVLLQEPTIRSCILSHLSINSFLSLSGSSEGVRRLFTGESVGRWVLREWEIQVGDSVRVWPNLTVWEGFLESLLHDPLSYGTYSMRWHALLRHLSLSHTLVVLYLRSLPSSAFPSNVSLPFEDDGPVPIATSPSSRSLSSLAGPLSRRDALGGLDATSTGLRRTYHKPGRTVEIVMPEPLASNIRSNAVAPAKEFPIRRRGSLVSLASATSLAFNRKRSNSETSPFKFVSPGSQDIMASLVANEKRASLPPVSYPVAKRYGFSHSDSSRSRRSSLTGRQDSIYSYQSLASANDRRRSINSSRPGSVLSSTQTRSIFKPPIWSPNSASAVSSKRDTHLRDSRRPEPAFDRPIPYIVGRAPVLRVFVPLSDLVPKWPSAQGADLAVAELEKCGALRRMRLGDLIVNTGIRRPRTTEHILIFIPFIKHLLVPLQYTYCSTGHLPSYIDAFHLPPSYYFPFFPSPQVVFVNLAPFAARALRSLRLAQDRRDIIVSSGAKMTAKRYLHIAGFEISEGDKTDPQWYGIVTLEAEGTAEGKRELEKRLELHDGIKSCIVTPWEIVQERSVPGSVWLKLVKTDIA